MSEQKKLWVWIPLGLALGLFVTFIMFLDGQKQNGADVKPQKNSARIKKDERAKPVFDFYTVLPERVVDVEGESIDETDSIAVKPKQKHLYKLQVGSFNNFADADKLKAELAFLGLQAKLATAKVKNTTWYRVELGPFGTDHKLSNAKNLLIQNKIKYLQKNAS